VKFLADGMLGKLTRWLRILGQDVIYSTEFNDTQLLETAKKEKRILLTKDLELYKRAITRGLNAYYIEGKSESKRLAELAKRYNIELMIDLDKSHCPICNTKIQETPKEELADQIEKNTYKYYNNFWKCPKCGQIYWRGAHWKQINNTINEAEAQLQKLKIKRKAQDNHFNGIS
jgi:uncharacterized protein with PIN domain